MGEITRTFGNLDSMQSLCMCIDWDVAWAESLFAHDQWTSKWPSLSSLGI